MQSKSTPLGASVKFATGGKTRQKKELGAMIMQAYPDVYVASVCLDANYNQVRMHATVEFSMKRFNGSGSSTYLAFEHEGSEQISKNSMLTPTPNVAMFGTFLPQFGRAVCSWGISC